MGPRFLSYSVHFLCHVGQAVPPVWASAAAQKRNTEWQISEVPSKTCLAPAEKPDRVTGTG